MKTIRFLTLIGLLASTPMADAATFVVNTTNVSPGAGETNLSQAITLANASTDPTNTINFNIPGTGPFSLVTPSTGYPFITNHNLTLNGYSQPGSAPNTNTILGSNTAVIMIVIDSTAGGSTVGETFDGTNGTPGIGPTSSGMLLLKGATNVHIRGLCFMGETGGDAGDGIDRYGIAVDGRSHYFHLSGCWVGIAPDRTTASHFDEGIGIHGNNSTATGIAFATNCTIGVAARTTSLAEARAQFNVIGRHGISVEIQGRNMRFSGNFLGVLPDGMTDSEDFPVTPDSVFENGRGANNLVFGTDGDGINDAEERNIVGGVRETGDSYIIGIYGGNDPEGAATNMVFAGNYFGLAVDGVTRLTNATVRVFDIGANKAQVRVGSDFNGVSDAIERNRFYNSLDFKLGSASDNSRWLSLRGNELVNNVTMPLDPVGGANVYNKFINDPIKPIITTLTATTLSGTCGTPVGAPYTRLIVDLYVADPEGDAVSDPQGKTYLGSFVDNSSADSNPAVGAFTFNIAGLGVTTGTKVTIAVTYSGDSQPQITSVSRSGGNTTLNIGGGTPNYNVLRASDVAGPYSTIAVATGANTTFADAAVTSFYRIQSGSSSGQTAPFADSVAVP